MKKLNFLLKIVGLLLTASIVSPTFTGCELIDGKDDKCEETKMDLIHAAIYPNIRVFLSNSDPAVGVNVKLNIYKQYCDGNIPEKGIFEKVAECDMDGFAQFGMTYFYKLENLDDIIYYRYTITQGELSHEVKGTVTYNEVVIDADFEEDEEVISYGIHAYEFKHKAIKVGWE